MGIVNLIKEKILGKNKTFRQDTEKWKKDHLEKYFCLHECRKECCKDLTVRYDTLPKELRKKYKKGDTAPPDSETREFILGLGFEITERDGETEYNLKGYCNAYDRETRKCRVHDNPLRPSFCGNFPVLVDGNCLFLSESCYISREICSLKDTAIVKDLYEMARKNKGSVYSGNKMLF
jgi:Fe-S-cluster containining protein